MAMSDAFEFLDTDGQHQVNAAALMLAAEILNHAVPAPKVERNQFPHELTGLARFILDGTDVFNRGDDA